MPQGVKDTELEFFRALKLDKLLIRLAKRLSNQLDPALAYSPCVSYTCDEIAESAVETCNFTAKVNLVACKSIGTAVAVQGLGSIEHDTDRALDAQSSRTSRP